jgi:hypothetical protein
MPLPQAALREFFIIAIGLNACGVDDTRGIDKNSNLAIKYAGARFDGALAPGRK